MGGKGELVFNGDRRSVWEDEKGLEMGQWLWLSCSVKVLMSLNCIR